MHIRYTHHARQRMLERKVSETQVELALEQPDELTMGEQDEWIAIRTYGNRRIQVVYGDLDDSAVLIYTVISVRILR
ncbi:MAG: DUF4258 domain-containing protein [Caldilineaceae bacterium]|nr:DUF4258 domain-containing protein [Caldilineaceae bacterium]